MKEIDFKSVSTKVEELRAIFILGQRVIPFLEELFNFVGDIKPLLDDINLSIVDNLKKMPKASKQLSKVTEATELATNEIMDVVDNTLANADIMSNNIKEFNSLLNKSDLNPITLLNNKLNNNEFDKNTLVNFINGEYTELMQGLQVTANTMVNSLNLNVNKVIENSNSIMMALQVQDITSQQLGAVNHLLETIQYKLATIIKRFNNEDLDELLSAGEKHANTNITQLHREIAFDPEAVGAYDTKLTKQDEVDDIINSPEKYQNNNNKPVAANDIDAAFNLKATQPLISVAVEEFDEVSQDDIDALFGNL